MSRQHHAGADVNAAAFLDQVDRSGEVDFKGLPRRIAFTTPRSRYEYDPHAGKVRGGVFGDEWINGRFLGATFGGSMLAIERLIPGAFGAIAAEGHGEIRTGVIESIEVESVDSAVARKRAAR